MFAMPYTPHHQANQLICGSGQVAVVTGWTVREAVAKRLQPQDYGVIGNLYSATRGLSPLVRNLLANPHIRYLLILQATPADANAGSCQCLWDFLERGFRAGVSETGRACWCVESAIAGYIDGEISATALTALRQNLIYERVRSLEAAVDIVGQWSRANPLPLWGPPQTFPQAPISTKVFPGPRYGHRIEGETIAATWVKILHRIKTTGTVRPSPYGEWQELIDLTAIVTAEPEGFYFPSPNYLPIEPQFVADYINQILADAPPQEGVKYTYGQRLRSWFGRDQIQQAIDKLSLEPDSTRVVLSLWDVQDYEQNNSPPCLNHIWLRIVAGELSLTATFRSNDMFSAWPANAMGLRALQEYVLRALEQKGLKHIHLGPLILISQSAHIYQDCWEQADQIIASQYSKLHRPNDYFDPCGSFLISLQDNQIWVEHLTPGSGEVVNRYHSRSALQLYRRIAQACPNLAVDHALYLGIELQKAETALTLHQPQLYRQDLPLRLPPTLTTTANTATRPEEHGNSLSTCPP
jgi:thymidylate synthase